MGVPIDIAELVSKIIDVKCLHDPRKNKRFPIRLPICIARDMYVGFPKINVKTYDILQELPEMAYSGDYISFAIPSRLQYSTCLEGIAAFIQREGSAISQIPEKVIDCARIHASDVSALNPSTFEKAEGFVKDFAKDVLHGIVNELKAKGARLLILQGP